ncbi:Cytidylate kinase [Candidatus Westeberhardia cardiocondylae]|uniref:Cytidylate kinase n=1 Tax=Candidatus Westeberhardia cardiocondylae TaxID=1594731 RepID=A0A0H5BWS6_9ENTR|nr:(d)CMP kinase [Candidatus Westeberhardia cardiocondylae]CEN32190.1 Cytidylate kinase [Candidatus Westeberhardia cardiocondylae]
MCKKNLNIVFLSNCKNIVNGDNKSLPPVITVDGPSASGKGTLCATLAKILQWNFLDSGVIYRTINLLSQYHNIIDEKSLLSVIKNSNMSFKIQNNQTNVMLENKDISWEIRNHRVNNTIFHISSFPNIRKMLLNYQRRFRAFPGLIADGRDMGTVVFPDAKIKIFLDADIKKRAKRRFRQLQKNNVNVTLNNVLYEIKKRDDYDRNRIISPLVRATNSLVLDSTYLNEHEVVKEAMKYINNIGNIF